MRGLVFLLATVGFASAAPIPTDKSAERKPLEAAWNDLWSYDPIARTRAVFALLDHPKTVSFLAEKLPPVLASKDQLATWVKALNDPDEKVWQAALNELWYHDPRTGLTPDEQLDLIDTDQGRWLLARVWSGYDLELRPDTLRTSLTRQPGNARWFMFMQHQQDGRDSGTGINCAPVSEIALPTWQRAAVAAHILWRIDTTASRAVLDQLAAGHKEALPTRTAVELLKAKAPERLTGEAFDKVWADLLTTDPVATTRGVFALRNAPDAVKKLTAELPAIKASKEQIKAWVIALDSEDDEVWKPACEKLMYFHPLLGLSWEEQCDTVTTDHGRSRMFWLAGGAAVLPTGENVYPDCMLTPKGDEGLTLIYPAGGGRLTTWQTPGTLATLCPPQWQRARLAVLVLERIGTAEAKAVLQQLADGHSDILPTKEAKAALDRLKEK